MKKKTGIFICSGCKIGNSLKVDELSEKMSAELQPVLCKTHHALCSLAGQEEMRKALDSNELEACIVAACGKGVKDDAFDLGDAIILERSNIREMVAWSMEANAEDTMMAAEDYIRMSAAGVEQMQVVRPFILDEISERILVVGGGVAGLQAAILGAESGYDVTLLEKSDELGGWSAAWEKQIPFDAPFKDLKENVVAELVAKVKNSGKIELKLNALIERIDGQPGAFEVKLKGDEETHKAGAIVSAMGWKPYDLAGKSLYGHGEVDGVISSVEFETVIKEGRLGAKKSVLFIQCAGSRDKDHLPYCSSVCCGVSLKQAKYIRERSPETVVYILYKDIRTPGYMEEFYKEVQDDPNIVFIKGDATSVKHGADGIHVEVDDKLLGESLQVVVDQVVLATGMQPRESSDLKLAYRLGEGLPELKYEFADSHFICFPYESRRTGIYAVGGLRAPMDIPAAMEDAAGGMMKAIQMVESVKRGDAVHPRAGDQSYPELYLERCTDCKRCTEECPFGTFDETESGTPVVNPNRCRRCGICLGACPERVISFADYSINIVSEKIKAVEVPDEFDEKPRVLVFMCENDAYPALEGAIREGAELSPYVRIVPVRCLGSINRVWVSDALSKGYDGILQIGCKPGDDYQCHFIHGSELTEQRSEIYEETLSSMMLEPERIATEFVEITDTKLVVKHMEDYMEEVDLMGPNPFKDM